MGRSSVKKRNHSSSGSQSSQNAEKSQEKKHKENHVGQVVQNVAKTMTTRSANSAVGNPPPQAQSASTAPTPAAASSSTQPISPNSSTLETKSSMAKTQAIFIECDSKVANNIIDGASSTIKNPTIVGSSSNGRTKIVCGSKEDKVVVMKALEDSNLQFHSHPEKDEKEQVYILKGMWGYNDKEVSDELSETLKDFTTKIVRISKVDSKYPVFRVQFSGNKVSLEFLRHNCKYLGRNVISWEPRRKMQGKVTQCFRCQEFGHVSSQCHRSFRCVKCSQSHGAGNCARKDKESTEVPLKCANCGQNHAANFIDCEKRKEFLARTRSSASRQAASAQRRPTPQIVTPTHQNGTTVTQVHQNIVPSTQQTTDRRQHQIISARPPVPAYSPPGPPPECPWTIKPSLITNNVSACMQNPESNVNRSIFELLVAQNKELMEQNRLLTARIISLEEKFEQIRSGKSFHSYQVPKPVFKAKSDQQASKENVIPFPFQFRLPPPSHPSSNSTVSSELAELDLVKDSTMNENFHPTLNILSNGS